MKSSVITKRRHGKTKEINKFILYVGVVTFSSHTSIFFYLEKAKANQDYLACLKKEGGGEINMYKYVYECKQCGKLETIESNLEESFLIQEGLCLKCRNDNINESYRRLYEIVRRLRIEGDVCVK